MILLKDSCNNGLDCVPKDILLVLTELYFIVGSAGVNLNM